LYVCFPLTLSKGRAATQVRRPANKNPASLSAPRIAAHTKESQSRTNLLFINGLPACWIRAATPVRLFTISAEKSYHEKSFCEIFLDNTTAGDPDHIAEKRNHITAEADKDRILPVIAVVSLQVTREKKR